MERRSKLVMENCVYRRNTGSETNVLSAEPQCEINIASSFFRGNRGGNTTLSISDRSQLVITNSTFVNNRATQGGVLKIQSLQTQSSVVVRGESAFRNNEALTEGGGAIFIRGNVSLEINGDAIFSRNKAAHQGGALFLTGPSIVNISDAYFIENESLFLGGGAIFTEHSANGDQEVLISNTIFSRNAARNQLGSGGAIRVHGLGVRCTIHRGTSFSSNHAEFDGGAIHVSNVPSMLIQDASFVGNDVLSGGAAALFLVTTVNVGFDTTVMNLTIQSCVFLFNTAQNTFRGGSTLGFVGARTEVVIEDSKFHQNECATGSGAAIYIFEGPSIQISNSSFVDNRATWGGAIYAEMNSICNISSSEFQHNSAEEGGAINTRGNVDLEVLNTRFINNSAIAEGGAVRSENHDISGGVGSLFTFTNSVFENNNAGFDLAANAVQGRVTRGGGIAVIGQGQYARLINNTFHNNSASEGGGIAAIGPRLFSLSGHSRQVSNTRNITSTVVGFCRFDENIANFGGGIFAIVDNSVNIIGGLYRIQGVDFMHNIANSDGGAIRLGSLNSNNDLFPSNADAVTVRIAECDFIRNRATRIGGGLAATGVGLEMEDLHFWHNSAISVSSHSSSGQGGAIALTNGASARIESAYFIGNEATNMGGGVLVLDSASFFNNSHLRGNLVYGVDGNGGAIALLLTSDRLIPNIQGGLARRNVLLECNATVFRNNSAPLQGGAIYHRHSNPNEDYTESWNCNNSLAVQLEDYRGAQQYNSTCAWINAVRDRLQNRVVRLAGIQFDSNRAQNGAALFTNHPAMIAITDGSAASDGDPLLSQAQNSVFLTESGIVFTNNSNKQGGYGAHFASFPVRGVLTSNDANFGAGSSILTFAEFRSGDRLKFDIEFEDAFAQRVSAVANFTGEITFNSLESDSLALELSGQTSSRMNDNGLMRFTGTKLAGRTGMSYTLKLQFLLRGQELTMEESLSIKVTMRECRIGEFTRIDDDVIECIQCGAGTFSSNASEQDCTSCEDIEGGRCFGLAAVPENHYWHATSFSLNMIRCIGNEACSYKGRFSDINHTETEAHLQGKEISYKNGTSAQCKPGYEGILCGSCEDGYGREGDRCRKCDSEALRYFVLILLILWSIAFLGYFVRSVLQLSARIEFNRKLRMQAATSPVMSPSTSSSLQHASHRTSNFSHTADILPHNYSNTSSATRETEPFFDDTNTFPVDSSRPSGVIPAPTSRDLAMMLAHQIRLERQETLQQNTEQRLALSNTSRGRRQTRLTARIQQLQNNPTMQDAEPLTLGNPVSEVLKILINFLQVTSMAVSLNNNWTDPLRRTLLVLGSAGSLAGGTAFFSFDCFLESNSIPKSLRRMTVMALYPVFMFLFFATVFIIRAYTKQKPMKYLTQRIWLSYLCINYFFYIGMTKNLLRFFACVEIDEDVQDITNASLAASFEDSSYWEEDTSVACYSRRHAFLIGILVIPLLFAVSIGYPVGIFYILYSNASQLDDEDFIGTYGFLYRGYDIHYWEIVIMLRKGLVAAVAVFAYGLGQNIQGLVCVLILVVSLALQLTFTPFTKEIPQLNYLETCSLSTTIVVFVSGLIFNDPKSKNATEVFLSIWSILMIVATVLLLLVSLCIVSEEVIDMLLLENNVLSVDEVCDARLSFRLEQLVYYYIGKFSSIGNHVIGAVQSRHRPVRNQSPAVEMRTR
eukprot:g8019.t1